MLTLLYHTWSGVSLKRRRFNAPERRFFERHRFALSERYQVTQALLGQVPSSRSGALMRSAQLLMRSAQLDGHWTNVALSQRRFAEVERRNY